MRVSPPLSDYFLPFWSGYKYGSNSRASFVESPIQGMLSCGMQKSDVGGGLCAILLLGLWALSFSNAGAYETLYMLKIRRKRCDVKHLENRFILACCIYIRAGVCLGGLEQKSRDT